MEIVPYCCIRCGYKVKNKYHMRHHLYERKKKCPGTVNKIELTDTIKEEILENRIYHMPKNEREKKEPTIIQNIQNNNILNNFIGNMDTFEKLDKYMNYKQLETISLEDDIENKFAKRIDNMKGDKFKYGYDLQRLPPQTPKFHQKTTDHEGVLMKSNIEEGRSERAAS